MWGVANTVSSAGAGPASARYVSAVTSCACQAVATSFAEDASGRRYPISGVDGEKTSPLLCRRLWAVVVRLRYRSRDLRVRRAARSVQSVLRWVSGCADRAAVRKEMMSCLRRLWQCGVSKF